MSCLFQKIIVLFIIINFASFSLSYTIELKSGHEMPGETCEVEKGVFGICEENFQCDRNRGVSRIRNKIKLCATSSNGKMYVCCRRPFEIAHRLCDKWKDFWRDKNENCINEKALIATGKDVKAGMFPEMTVVGVRQKNEIKWICGGTLISPFYVLTAAHCVYKKYKYVVRLGEHDLYYQQDLTNVSRQLGPVPKGLYGEYEIHSETRNYAPIEQTINVKKVMIYPSFEYRSKLHDIALLRLEKSAVLTKRVLPACLPYDPKETFENLMLTVIGWGMTKYRYKQLYPTLQKIEVPIIPSVTCAKTLSKFFIPKGIHYSHMCAGEREKSFCDGDSGGPLLLQVRKNSASEPCEHTVAGVVSFANGCSKPNVYARVSYYLNWITRIIAPKLIPLGSSSSKECDND